MHKSRVLYGIATATLLACCTVSAGTLKAATAEAISEVDPTDSRFEARGGHGGGHGGGGHGGGHGGGGHGGGLGGGWSGGGGGGGGGFGGLGGLSGGWNSGLHGHESFTGPSAIAFALPIAVALIVALWVAAYNTLRSPAPKIGYNAGIVESAGWGGGGAQANFGGGYGYEPQGSEQQSAVASNIAQTAIVQAAAGQGSAGAAATGRAIDNLTHRVVRSIERQQKRLI